ncbi:2-phosphosulfolactate phosphatase [Salidesulfovibrio brasiliensis]|uniref:2-phosphosulfolactate phosphatase n=1 Tax=Salidesulfovibrio brasiliensis TaxID=221711 RepID=UPI0006D063E7|nr:2-phosphosulfolactate phosphatase [Salidesulfovibrio brasiliensis]
MKIQIVEGLEGAAAAEGLAVVIDVFRAFSVACRAVDNGASEYYAVASEESARRLASERGAYLMGERNAVPLPGFDFGNSPTVIENVDFSGKPLVHTTSAGTQGLIASSGADEIITGAFVNAGAVAEYIARGNHDTVTLVALGTGGVERSMEDTMCAMYIKNAVEDYPNSFEALKKFMATIPSAQKFFDPEKEYAPERDFELCMELDRYDFVLGAEPFEEDAVRLVRVGA